MTLISFLLGAPCLHLYQRKMGNGTNEFRLHALSSAGDELFWSLSVIVTIVVKYFMMFTSSLWRLVWRRNDQLNGGRAISQIHCIDGFGWLCIMCQVLIIYHQECVESHPTTHAIHKTSHIL